ncbi:protein xmas [Euwallacea similis]|uniref:protein xmas n=1 Tax=Euwallacea similis TaxID=1736056 RepID=UPI00344E7781
MNPDTSKPVSKTFKITCSLYPDIFDLDRSLCKSYFRQYGKIVRLIFKPKQRSIVIEFTNLNDYLNALAGPSEYEGHSFKVEPFEPPTPSPPKTDPEHISRKKMREKYVKKHKLFYLKPDELAKRHVSYINKTDIDEELAAMGGYTEVKNVVDFTADNAPLEINKAPKALKLNRVWKRTAGVSSVFTADKSKKALGVKKKIGPVVKNANKGKIKMLTAEQLELLKIVKSQTNTVEERYRLLDARDKLLRLNLKKSHFKSSPTVGTCPDMCPEKERLLREVQHQVALYEQDGAGKHSMDASKAIKQYSRSSADQESPLPHELRPVSVLQMTMIYLMCDIMELAENDSEVNMGEWFHFVWDRTRGIRKDITQQALCCQQSVQLVEQCARFHIYCSARLMGEDPSVFDQKINTENLTKCLQTLKYMYHDLQLKGEQCSNEAEFRSYIILLNLSDGNFMWEVQQLHRDIQKSPEVKFALQVYSAFEKRNYVKFFKLIRSSTYLNACILMRYFVQVRQQAIESLIKCFTPPKSISFYPIHELTHSLFFDDDEATIDFMKTYGIEVNKDCTSFLIERSSFITPEFPYVLERSRCVEEKKKATIGVVVNGAEISSDLYMKTFGHVVQNSFDENGFLVHDEMFNELELSIEDQLLDEGDSRESTPERKNVASNIFSPKTQQINLNVTRTTSPNVFGQPKEDVKNIFAPVVKAPNIFGQTQSKPEAVGNIFAQPVSRPQSPENIFASKLKDDIDLFTPKDEIDNKTASDNIFSSQLNPNIFDRGLVSVEAIGNEANQNVFRQTNIFASSATNNRDPRLQHREQVFNPTNIFATKEPQKNSEIPKKGGFSFVLNCPTATTEVPNIFPSDYKRVGLIQPLEQMSEFEKRKQEEEEQRRKVEVEERKRAEQEVRRWNEEIRRKNEEAAEKRRLEAERIKQEVERKLKEEAEKKVREEQERVERERRLERERQLEEERKRQEEEMRRRLAEMEQRRKEAEEERKRLEIEFTVRSVVTKMVEAVDLKLRHDALKRISGNIKRRSLIRICQKWRSVTVSRMKKRKAFDCRPTFVNTKSVNECARDFQAKSQKSALSDMKRYKYGYSFELLAIADPPIQQLKLFHLTYSSLRRRLCELKEKWHQHIYWKVVISLPDINEVITGLHKLERMLKSRINWQLNKYGNTIYIEQHKTVTYCVEKQQGFEVKNSDASAYIFIAKDFNEVLQKRIFENLKDFGVHVKLPVVLILEDNSNSEEYLLNLKANGIVSDYMIYSCHINSSDLLSVIDNGLIFLAKRVEKYPPLEMDTLYGFLTTYLCTEIWKKSGSYAKWNLEYNFCMRDPNIVINLYNEALSLLTKIVTDKNCKEYATFPEIFREYFSDKFPDYLPCDYRHFPTFWVSPTYENLVKSALNDLKLPNFLDKWPPDTKDDLERIVTLYCSQVFKQPNDHLSAVLNVLKEGALDGDFRSLTWIEAIQVIARELLKEHDFSLPKEIFSDVFSTLIVIYDVNVLNDYSSSEWFYRNNPTIEGFKKIISNKTENFAKKSSESTRKRLLETCLDSEDIQNVIDKAEKSLLRSPKSMCLEKKNEMKALNRSIQDLEDSIKVVLKMDEMNLFKRFIDN